MFVPLAPIMMALTAASPVFKGKLSGLDTRFSIIEQSVDDRTDEERSAIPKSRYSSVNYYISNSKFFKEEYNDINSRLNTEVMDYLKEKAEEKDVDMDR